MGWFAIACVVGFASYRWRHILLNDVWPWLRLQPPRRVARVVVLLATLILGLDVLFSIGTRPWHWHTPLDQLSQVLDGLVRGLGTGTFARIVFGIVLGAGVAHTFIGRGSRWDGTGLLPPPGSTGAITGTISIGVALIILAAVAPHLDRWLARLTGVKSSILEIQLNNISRTQEAIVPDLRENYIDYTILQDLSKYYNEVVVKDIDFIDRVVLPPLQQKHRGGLPGAGAR
jgi:hypothetical protein